MTTVFRRTRAGRIVFVCLLSLVAAGVAVLHGAPARADGIPNDLAIHGYVGFCGIDDKPMTGGSLHDAPFVWKAVASGPPPPEVQGKGAVATLYAYQPRPNVPAAEWTADQITATSPYSTPDAPTTQATKLDEPFQSIVSYMPPLVNGLYEIRMYLGNAQNMGYTDQYPATFIQVTGDRWKVVQGGTVDCGKGQAVSPEIAALGSASAAGTPTVYAPFGGPSGTGVPKDAHGVPVAGETGAAGSHSPGGSTTSPTSSHSAQPTSDAVPTGDGGLPAGMTISSGAASASSSGGGSWEWVAVLVIVVVFVGAGGAWLAYRRSRRRPA